MLTKPDTMLIVSDPLDESAKVYFACIVCNKCVKGNWEVVVKSFPNLVLFTC